MKNITSKHHKKLTVDIPAWLWFPLYHSVPHSEWTDDKDKLAKRIIKSLKTHLEMYAIDNKVITEPNLHDFCGMYSAPNERGGDGKTGSMGILVNYKDIRAC